MPPATPAIRLAALSKRFGQGPLVLSGIDLTVAAGELVALLGPSGCGKSTLLRLVAGLLEPSAGTVEVEGARPSEARERMAFIFQEATLLPWLTVRANIELPLRLRGEPAARRREKALRLAALTGLEAAVDYHPRQLSGGMKMRASLARALTLSPDLLLLDEPFAALDALTRHRLNEELLRLRQHQAWTALFVTHSVPEAVFLSSRIALLRANPGRLERVVEVPHPYPRPPAWRDSLEFQRLCAEVGHCLRDLADATDPLPPEQPDPSGPGRESAPGAPPVRLASRP